MASDENAKVHVMDRRGRRRMTIQERIFSLLGKHKGFVNLKTIYKSLRASTVGDKAGIRGVLNRGCSKGGVFKRSRKAHGEYTLVA